MRPLLILASAVLVAGCTRAPTTTTPTRPTASIEFIHDDYPAALARAKAEGKPLFVDAWAPWCHSCVSMNAFVFPDPALAPMADRFVWLSLDTERAENAAFLEKYPVDTWPSLFVIQPQTGEVVLRSFGSATVPELLALLEQGERAALNRVEGPEAKLAEADRLHGERRNAEAVPLYLEVLEGAPTTWPLRTHAIDALVIALEGAGDHAGCMEAAKTFGAQLPPSPERLRVLTYGVMCALRLPPEDAKRVETLPTLVEALDDLVRQASSDAPPMVVADDDVSGGFGMLVDAYGALGRQDQALEAARRWTAFIETATARAKTPAQRAVFDSHRVSAYLAAKNPAGAIPMLEQSERDFPDDYNPPARLAVIYEALGRLDDALAANGRALEHVYGPRRLRVLQQRATLLTAKGDRPAARATLEEALRTFDALPAGQQHAKTRERIAAQLAALD